MRRLAATTTFIAFAGGTATGVIAMWFASVQPALPVVLSTTQAVTPVQMPAPPERSTPTPDMQLAAEATRAGSTPASSIVSAVPRTVGTSGRSTELSNQAVAASRAGGNRPARRGNEARTPASYRGSLVFGSAPQNARVFVNGAFVGSTPLVLENLPVGSRAVRIEADGYQRWSAATRVVANQQTRVSATLAPAVR